MSEIKAQTLEEFLKDKKLGEVKIRSMCWDKKGWFMPYYSCSSKYHGLSDNQSNVIFLKSMNDTWELYKEPKPKVMRAMYLYKYEDCSPAYTHLAIKDDEEFLNIMVGVDRIEWFKRLDEAECES